MIDKWIDTVSISNNNSDSNQNNNQQNEERQRLLYFGCFKYDPAVIGPRIKRPFAPLANDFPNNNG